MINRKPLGVFLPQDFFKSMREKTPAEKEAMNKLAKEQRRAILCGFSTFRECFRKWVWLACKEWGYNLPNEAYYSRVFARIPSEVMRDIDYGIRKGFLIQEGWKFKFWGLSSEKGPYKWFSRYIQGKYPACNWEYFVQAAEYCRLLVELLKRKNIKLNFEDKLMDITIYENNKLLMCIEVKEKESQLKELIGKIQRYSGRIDWQEYDRHNDPLRKAKYIVNYKPELFSGVAGNYKMTYHVKYETGDRFSLIPLSDSERTLDGNSVEEKGVTPEEYGVYSKFLSGNEYTLVVENWTSVHCYRWADELSVFKSLLDKELDKEMFYELWEKNSKSYKLENKFKNKLRIEMLSQEKYQFLWGNSRKEFWMNFHKKYPGFLVFLITLSRVVFDKSKNTALFYIGHLGGPLFGWGQLVLMKKKSNKWIIDRTDELWIS